MASRACHPLFILANLNLISVVLYTRLTQEEAGDLIDDQDTVAEQAERSAADHAQFRQLNRQQEEKSAEEIARHIEERYKAMEEGGPGYEDEDMLTGASGAVGQQAMLPTVNDPKLWMVKARAGHEREACIQLLQKSYNLQRKGTPILIKSAFALDHLKVGLTHGQV